jgi:uncharacterized membrane protein
MGATPEQPAAADAARLDLSAWATAAAAVLNPALSSFNAGVRGYYFALAAGAWLAGPVPFLIATLGAVGLLVWRQTSSPASRAIHEVRLLVEGERSGQS